MYWFNNDKFVIGVRYTSIIVVSLAMLLIIISSINHALENHPENERLCFGSNCKKLTPNKMRDKELKKVLLIEFDKIVTVLTPKHIKYKPSYYIDSIQTTKTVNSILYMDDGRIITSSYKINQFYEYLRDSINDFRKDQMFQMIHQSCILNKYFAKEIHNKEEVKRLSLALESGGYGIIILPESCHPERCKYFPSFVKIARNSEEQLKVIRNFLYQTKRNSRANHDECKCDKVSSYHSK